MSASDRSSELTNEEKLLKLKNYSIIIDAKIRHYQDIYSQKERDELKAKYDKFNTANYHERHIKLNNIKKDHFLFTHFPETADDFLNKRSNVSEEYNAIQFYSKNYLALLDEKNKISAEMYDLKGVDSLSADAERTYARLEKQIAEFNEKFKTSDFDFAFQKYNKIAVQLENIKGLYPSLNITYEPYDLIENNGILDKLPQYSTLLTYDDLKAAKPLLETYLPLKIQLETLRSGYQACKDEQRKFVIARCGSEKDAIEKQITSDREVFPKYISDIKAILEEYKSHLNKSFKFDNSSEIYKSKLAIVEGLQQKLSDSSTSYSPRLQITEFMENLDSSAKELTERRYKAADANSSYAFRAYSVFRSMIEPETTSAEKMLDKIGAILKEAGLKENNPYKISEERKSKFCFK